VTAVGRDFVGHAGGTMANEERKADIRRRLLRARYPQRSNAEFTDENDHNPLVLRDCPACRGYGAMGECGVTDEGAHYHARFACPACGGSGVVAEVEPFFPDDHAEAEVRLDRGGWATCPRCGWRFTPRDRNAWTGRRHVRCGQKIKLT
jgi:hypothetical protein